MVLKINGNSEIGAHVWSDLGYLICLRHMFISRVVIRVEKTYHSLYTLNIF